MLGGVRFNTRSCSLHVGKFGVIGLRKSMSKTRDATDNRLYLLGRDETRALELARRILMARAGEEVVAIEIGERVVPAAVAGVIIDDPVRGREFVAGMSESGDHNNRRSHRPGEPRQAA